MSISQRKIDEVTSGLRPIDIMAELFRKGDFSFIVEGFDEEGNKVSHEKQRKALEILTSGKYDEFLYGGAAGGAKTWTGCVWIMFMSICYPGIKSFIGRNQLGDILDSVKVTFDKVAKAYGFEDYNFNAQKNFIKLDNGSHINMIEVKYKPSDPMYEDVGSTEYTIGWGEEIGEWHETAATVLGSRVGRHLNKKDLNGNYWTISDENGKKKRVEIKGTVLWTCNPKQNWGKTQFYDKNQNGTLESNKAYLQCLITENPFIEKDYVRKMSKMADKNKTLYERLFKGNWDYDDNPYQLAEQEMIDTIFENDQVREGKTYLTADVARQGSDKAVIMAWSGWIIKEIITYDKSSIPDIVHAIKYLRNKYRIPRTRCIADGDGVGGGVIDYANIKEFRNGGRPIKSGKDTPNYRNLQIQCLYLLAEKINEGGIWINADIENKVKEDIKVELAQIQSVPNKRDDNKLDCKAKGDIKSDIGRSPDYRDAIFMRMFFELKSSFANLTTNWS
jgi:phage terminase large subunit